MHNAVIKAHFSVILWPVTCNKKHIKASHEEKALEAIAETLPFLVSGRCSTLFARFLTDLVRFLGNSVIKIFIVLLFGEKDLLEMKVIVLVVFYLLVKQNFHALLL